MSVVHEVAADTYEPTRLASALVDPLHAASILYSVEVFVPAFFALPEFLKKTNYTVPRDPLDSPFQLWFNTKEHMFEWIHKRPELMQEFNKFMGAYSLSRKRWMEPGCVPIDEVLANDASKDPDSVFLVDVGGGNGHDLMHFQKNYPDISGRLILQDLPGTIETAKDKLTPGIEAMAHDFFTPQPIKGARAYYLHSILHDWPTQKCHEILSNLIPALTPGYSKILINENVIPDQGAYWENTGLDWVMLTLYSSEERREKIWRELCEGVGLKINRIWEFEKGTESIIECELAISKDSEVPIVDGKGELNGKQNSPRETDGDDVVKDPVVTTDDIPNPPEPSTAEVPSSF
ncbi:putative sterigmatocystin 8-o-methyltransferase [Phaeomoniella chlamydospora]|uniref:Putative sterigmatocystin 8-o-methyltransferase n=1 Tax=Phaeomoniella chlamydospora TaxID=158046 RepID=A0A0G2GCS9_PHACM|nr:putative sterigmatocystin 8-o-methyltransferase [Phaeomoniella chlamydospora]